MQPLKDEERDRESMIKVLLLNSCSDVELVHVLKWQLLLTWFDEVEVCFHGAVHWDCTKFGDCVVEEDKLT